MKAIVRHAFGGPEQLHIEEVATPSPSASEVLIRVKAFGINRAEQYFRMGAWGDVHSISGIECIGEVESDPSGSLASGQKVLALMGGMGRSIAGSYAEYVTVPQQNVVALQSDLGWAELAALPESYATAWACLMDNLKLERGQTVVIRGATSALGQAAINIAHHAGIKIIATVRNPDRAGYLMSLGAMQVLEERPYLGEHIGKEHGTGVHAVLDIIGTATLLDSMKIPTRGGRVCMAGFLGGAEAIEKFNPLTHLPSGRHLSFFGSAFVFGKAEYPLNDIPFQQIIDSAANRSYQGKPAHVFQFNEIQAAHRLLDARQATGKIVVVIE